MKMSSLFIFYLFFISVFPPFFFFFFFFVCNVIRQCPPRPFHPQPHQPIIPGVRISTSICTEPMPLAIVFEEGGGGERERKEKTKTNKQTKTARSICIPTPGLPTEVCQFGGRH